ncbi:MAG: N-acetylmuramoyl-L-alanine amidase [Bacteroidia bacterium]|nr:N-acetylmuramoyl-L-alanine amidase [Bacteroidia bacterium]
MLAAKLLKKHELNMCTGVNNGKHNLINIYAAVILLLLLFTPCSIQAAKSDPKTDGKWIIVIDPGHGGRDPGASGTFSKEKKINLAIALKTGNYLKDNFQNVTVIYTRDDDSTVDLIERPRIANKNNADLFISIHSNWAKSKSVAGAETFVMGHTKDQENLEVAMKENEVILLEEDYSTKYAGFDPKSPESYIMFTLMQNVFLEQSTDLAAKVQNQFNVRVDRKDRGVKQAGFWVLYNTTMPSVLIETGFITNLAEEQYLNSEQGQDYLASAIFRACRDYMNEIDIKSGISAVRNAESGGGNSSGSLSAHDELVFMVQVATASSRKEIKPENFKGINDIVEINVQNRFKYATGFFTEYPEAVKYRKKIEAIYPDAFVIAVKDNKILPLQQALEQKRKKQN